MNWIDWAVRTIALVFRVIKENQAGVDLDEIVGKAKHAARDVDAEEKKAREHDKELSSGK
jgi:hypothetical protein